MPGDEISFRVFIFFVCFFAARPQRGRAAKKHKKTDVL